LTGPPHRTNHLIESGFGADFFDRNSSILDSIPIRSSKGLKGHPWSQYNQKYDFQGKPLTISGINSNLERNVVGGKVKNDFYVATIDEDPLNDFEISQTYSMNHSPAGESIHQQPNSKSPLK
jgi:hypothetical protein